MKKGLFKIGLIAAVSISFSLVGCGSSSSQPTSKPTQTTTKEASKTTTTPSDKTNTDTTSATKKDDPWTYFNNATWTGNYNGLKLQIEKVVVTDKGPKTQGGQIVKGQYQSYVGMKFKMINTTNNIFTAYPDQARLVTSTGEQIDNPNMFASDHIGGEIEGGVMKEGNIIWDLKRGHASDIKWVKIEWGVHAGKEEDFNQQTKHFEVKLNLK